VAEEFDSHAELDGLHLIGEPGQEAAATRQVARLVPGRPVGAAGLSVSEQRPGRVRAGVD
jgi:hypothetical protein